ncbi:MAG: c-type cytochrome [Gammaproteobacteria bacterium]|nr:c-type cytochrome [Gammaproteobacteria bacterium]
MSENNPFPNENNSGHVWDDNLRELLNDPPTWWRIGFHASWILVIVYTILYPSWPMLTTHYKGVMGWTAMGEYKEDLQSIEMVRAKYEEQLPNKSAAAIMADDDLSNYVVKSAKVLFGDNCGACHGTGGAGNPGYPVLADDDWLYGGTVNEIITSITNGRKGVMTAHGKSLSTEEIDELANAVMSGNPASSPLYMSKACFACHGPDGKGMAALGSANLTDGIYRFDEADQLASIKYTIKHGVNDASDPMTRNAEMPIFGGTKLTETDIKKLAIYVHKLGGGQ